MCVCVCVCVRTPLNIQQCVPWLPTCKCGCVSELSEGGAGELNEPQNECLQEVAVMEGTVLHLNHKVVYKVTQHTLSGKKGERDACSNIQNPLYTATSCLLVPPHSPSSAALHWTQWDNCHPTRGPQPEQGHSIRHTVTYVQVCLLVCVCVCVCVCMHVHSQFMHVSVIV